METISAADIDAHLCAGGMVVAASDRAARAVLAAFYRARRSEGRDAWAAPAVYAWQAFVRVAWDQRVSDIRLVLNHLQEQSLWQRIIAESRHSAAILDGPRRTLARLAMQGHALLCTYAPRYLNAKVRNTWEQDAAAFSRWLSAFEKSCAENDVVSESLLAIELISTLKSDSAPRPPLALVGFDRLLPVQEAIFEAWGRCAMVRAGSPADSVHFFSTPDQSTELSACARWCGQRLSSDPESTLLVVTQDIQKRRGEVERAFRRESATHPHLDFEFSLGVPLTQPAPVRSAHMLLRWLDGELGEGELDWLFSTAYAGTAAEMAALQACMRAQRSRGMQRTHWKLRTFLNQRIVASPLPPSWLQRMTAAQQEFQAFAQRELSPLEWADLVPQLLSAIGWAGAAAPTSAEFQAIRRWRQVLEACGSLGFDGRHVRWQEFLSDVLHASDETLFAPESQNAPVLITGPAESAGFTADAIWFLGADEDAWPTRGELHPLIPAEVQRNFAMPHSSAQLDWDLAKAMTTRLVTSAREINFSYARQGDGIDRRPSRLIAKIGGSPQPVPAELTSESAEADVSVIFEDATALQYRGSENAPHQPVHVRGGASLLSAQSQCAFRAFAIGRVGASAWEPAQPGLTAAERGQLLHLTLHSIWGAPPPEGIRTSADLRNVQDVHAFVSSHVRKVMATRVPSRAREEMPSRYLELESTRLTRLITEWLTYERRRVDFEVVDTERARSRTINGLTLDLRLDRLDRLRDGTLLVLDYKTGDVSPKSWDLPRPDDVQLPLYAGFGLDNGETVGGLAFAKIRAGDTCFAGRVGDARGMLDNTVSSASSLVKNPLTAEQLMAWREAIEQLAEDFLAGRADVDPRDGVRTCERCGLQTLCRIHERSPMLDETEAEAARD